MRHYCGRVAVDNLHQRIPSLLILTFKNDRRFFSSPPYSVPYLSSKNSYGNAVLFGFSTIIIRAFAYSSPILGSCSSSSPPSSLSPSYSRSSWLSSSWSGPHYQHHYNGQHRPVSNLPLQGLIIPSRLHHHSPIHNLLIRCPWCRLCVDLDL